jgi:trk system potassium uptake protein TrkA
MAEFAVIGIGRFGRAVARGLARGGESVLAIDRDRARLDQVAADVDSTVLADTTSETALQALSLDRLTACVVAIGPRATEASLLTTALLKEQGVAHIVARAFDPRHARVLLAVGAHEVVNPEDEMGARLAGRLAHPGIVDQIPLGDARLAEVEAPESLVGLSLAEADLGGRHRLSVLAIRRRGTTQTSPPSTSRIDSGDVLIVLGSRADIESLAELK